MPWEDVAGVLGNISGETCGGNQPEYLYQLSQQARGQGEIVEIGTNVGRTAIALSYAQKEKQGRTIYSVDIYRHRDIDTNLAKAGVTDYVQLIIGSSPAVAKTWDKPIELLWIDGDHSYTGAAEDIRRWARHVIPGGRVALHDYPGHAGSLQVWRAVYRLLLRRPDLWRVVGDREAGSIVVFERLDNAPSIVPARSWAYWMVRNARARLFTVLPRFSARVVKWVKGRSR